MKRFPCSTSRRSPSSAQFKIPGSSAWSAGLELVVLLAEPGAREQQQHDAADDGGRCVAELRQLVRYDMKTRRQLAGPLVSVLAIDRQRVLAGDAQQPLDDDAAVPSDEPRVGNDGEGLADHRLLAQTRRQGCSMSAPQRSPGQREPRECGQSRPCRRGLGRPSAKSCAGRFGR